MQAQELFGDLLKRGFNVTAEDDRLFVTPRKLLTPEDVVVIAAHKPALLDLLRTMPAPFIAESGDLRVPFNSHPRFHWWSGGQSIVEMLAELKAPADVWRRYAARNDDLLSDGHVARCKGAVARIGEVVYCAECRYFAVSGCSLESDCEL